MSDFCDLHNLPPIFFNLHKSGGKFAQFGAGTGAGSGARPKGTFQIISKMRSPKGNISLDIYIYIYIYIYGGPIYEIYTCIYVYIYGSVSLIL